MPTPATILWPLEPHSKAKHLVLRNYLDAWLPILGSVSGRLLFVDGFAGPGEYYGGEEGSPLIALRAFAEHKAKHIIKAEVRFIFIESDHARVEHLRQVVEPWRRRLPAPSAVDIIEGKFDETMAEALDSLDAQAERLAPAFVMIDPFGVSGTPMRIVRRILSNPKAEIYASFMYEAINRFKATPEFERHLTDLFGCEDWRAGIDIEAPVARRDFFYGLYERQLRQAGAQHVVHFEEGRSCQWRPPAMSKLTKRRVRGSGPIQTARSCSSNESGLTRQPSPRPSSKGPGGRRTTKPKNDVGGKKAFLVGIDGGIV